MINNIRRILNEVSSTDEQEQKVVYDLDELIVMDKMLGNGGGTRADNSGAAILGNTDEDIVNNFNEANPKNSGSQLEFESRFECGNLRKAIHTGTYKWKKNSSNDRMMIFFYFSRRSSVQSYFESGC